VTPLRKQHRQLQQRVDRLFDLLEREPEREIAAEYEQRIGAYKQEQRQLAAQITDLERDSEPVPAALDEAAVLDHLADLRSLLQQDIPEAASASLLAADQAVAGKGLVEFSEITKEMDYRLLVCLLILHLNSSESPVDL
jgi:hypothetical protein